MPIEPSPEKFLVFTKIAGSRDVEDVGGCLYSLGSTISLKVCLLIHHTLTLTILNMEIGDMNEDG